MTKLLHHPLVVVFLTAVAVLFIMSLRKTAQKGQVANQNVTLLESRIDQLSGQIEAEQSAIKYADTQLAKEKVLRNELLMQKPGEYVLQIPDDEVGITEIGTVEQKTAWQEWRELLF
ncbi:MAG TPA: hypothetical protein VGA89_01030 [Patescibacteria group bacterium]|jgi:cell division protein FtsB